MTLTPEREAEIMQENMYKCYVAANHFLMSPGRPTIGFDYDDLVQQCAEAFLKYIRKCEKEEDIEKFPWFDAKHAMCVQVLQSQNFTVPKSTKTFSRMVNSMPRVMNLDAIVTMGLDVDERSQHWVEDTETYTDFDTFMSDKDEAVCRMASMKYNGLTHRKIAGQFGVAKTTVTNKLDKLHDEFHEFFDEEDE